VVDPADYERVRDDVCAAAATLRDPEHGRPVVRRAWRREELYEGPWVTLAPDIVLELELDGRYSYLCAPSVTAPDARPSRVLDPAECRGGKSAGMSGSHRSDGVFLLGGVGIGTRRLQGLQIADLAPTILNLCGVQPLEEFDGKTIDPVAQTSQYLTVAGGRRQIGERVYEDTEEDEIAARLSALGYLQ
jgi:predicted AlkP superfamily phosphohydrolase/phosphomutase